MVPKLTKKSKVKFHRLFDRLEEGEYIIGREDTEEFIGVPKEGQAILDLLKKGKSIEHAEAALRKDFGELDVLDFAKTLEKEGFIKSIDGQIVHDKHKKVHHLFNWIRPEHVSWLFSSPLYFLYGVIIIAALVIMNGFPQYLPRYQDFFFNDSLTVIYVVSFFLGWGLVFGHEMSHFFGARSLGVPALFSISNRLYFLVAETDMSDIVEVDPVRRYRAYLAGMIFDAVTMSLCVLAMYGNDLGMFSIGIAVYRVLKAVVLVQILSLAWQFLFFMETDIYYVVENYFRSSDLMGETKRFVGNVWRRLLKKPQHPLDVDEREMRIVRIYSGFWFMSTFITLFRFFIYQLPISVAFVTKALMKFRGGGSGLVDGIIFVTFFMFDYGLLIYALHKRHKQRGKRFHLPHALHHLFHMHSRHKHR